MSTVTLEIEPKLYRQAESVLKNIGLEYSQEGLDDIKAGRCYTFEEAKGILGVK